MTKATCTFSKAIIHIILTIWVLVWCLAVVVTNGEINGPADDAPIRLSTTKKSKPITTPHHWKLHDPPSEIKYERTGSSLPPLQNQVVKQETRRSAGGAETTRMHHHHHHHDSSNHHDEEEEEHNDSFSSSSPIKIEIIEPPNSSYIAGQNFFVKIKIRVRPSDEQSFRKEYSPENEGHICLSLDDGLFHCWSLESANILYSQVTDGEHNLVAMLYKDGSLQNETRSEEIMFTMVHDPQFLEEEDDDDNSTAIRHLHHQSTRRLNLEDGTISEDGEDANDVGGVDVSYPVVQIINPAHQVSYTGTKISIETLVEEPQNPELFQKYFKYSFTCFNIDSATAYACFSLFHKSSSNLLVIGLSIGMHTIVATLSNPETRDILEDSSSLLQTFFMAGEDDVGAYAVADVNIKGIEHKIPLVEGSSIMKHAKHLCFMTGSRTSDDCIEPVVRHLQKYATIKS